MAIRLFLIFALFLILFSSPTFAQNESDLRAKIEEKNKEIERLEREIKEYQGSLGEVEVKSKTLKSEIARVEAEIKNLNSQISLTQKKIQKKEFEIKDLGSQITQSEISIKNFKNALSHNLRKLNEAEALSAIEVIFTYRNISDFLGALEENQKLNLAINQSVNELNDSKTFLSGKNDFNGTQCLRFV